MIRTTLLTCVAVLSLSLVFAQETTSELTGAVSDSQGLPISRATVTVRDGTTGFERSTTTGTRGQFRFAGLVPSAYELKATAAGFQDYERTLVLQLGQNLRHNFSMAVASFSGELNITGRTSALDLRSTTPSLIVNAGEQLGSTPIQREVTQIALLAPGTARSPRFWEEPTVGSGLHTPGQSFATIGGSSFGENAYVVDGLNLSNFRYGLGSSFVPLAFVDEVQVKLGGFEAEYGRATGGVINMVTRRGSNEFRGGLSVFLEPEALQEHEPDTFLTLGSREERDVIEGNAWIGGPVIRDRLFFFAALQYTDYSAIENYGFLSNTDRHVDRQTPYLGGKIDWLPTPAHRVEATYFRDAADWREEGMAYDPSSGETIAELGTVFRDAGGDNAVIRYSGVLRDNLLISAAIGRNEFARGNRSDGQECPHARDERPGHDDRIGCGGIIWRNSGEDIRNVYRADVDWFLGNHSLRGGIDLELKESRESQEFSGGVQYIYWQNGVEGGDPNDFWFPELPWNQDLVSVSLFFKGGVFDTNSYAAYVQDSWAARPGLTVNFGLRWEGYENKNGLGQTFIETNDQWAPRLGVVWDPSADGRSKLYGSFGIFHFPVLSKFNINLASAVTDTEAWYEFDAEINSDGSPSEIGEQVYTLTRADGLTPDPREVLSDNFDPMSQQELVIGYERLIGNVWTVGVRGVIRRFDRVLEDYSINLGLYQHYGVECANPALVGSPEYCGHEMRLGNPGADFSGWHDIDGDGDLDRIFIPAEATEIPSATRNRYAVDLTFSRRFSENWAINGSYTWSHTEGNYGGVIDSDRPSDPRELSTFFDSGTVMENSNGDLSEDRRHILKLFGQYVFDFGFSIGTSFFYQTGRPINSFGRHPTDPFAQSIYNPYALTTVSFFTNGEPRPRGCCGRTDEMWNVDLLLRYDFRALKSNWFVRLDVFNVTNNASAEMYWDFAEVPSGFPHPFFGEVFFYQRARIVRLGAGWSF